MSSRRKRSPEEQARREKIRELLQSSGVSSMEDIQNLFKETIAEFMENGLDAELDTELGYSRYDYKNKDTDNSRKPLRTVAQNLALSFSPTHIPRTSFLPSRLMPMAIYTAFLMICPSLRTW